MNNIASLLAVESISWPVVGHYILLAAIFLAFALVVYFVFSFIYDRTIAALQGKETKASSAVAILASILVRTPRISLGAAAIALAIAVFGLWNFWLKSIFLAVFLIQAGLWASSFCTALLAHYLNNTRADHKAFASAYSLMRVLSLTVLWSLIFIVVLSNFGINVTAMIAGLGIGGIAIGLAAQGIFADLFGSLAIVFDKPFVQGDFIVFNGNAGTIEHVGIKSTRVRSLSGEQIVLSNANLLNTTIHNYQRLRERRILFGFGITYQTSHAKVSQIPDIVREIIENSGNTRFDRCHFKEYGDSALLFETVYFVLSPEYGSYMDAQQHINLEMMRKFEELGVEFAYPTQTLFFGAVPGSDPDAAEGLTEAGDTAIPRRHERPHHRSQ